LVVSLQFFLLGRLNVLEEKRRSWGKEAKSICAMLEKDDWPKVGWGQAEWLMQITYCGGMDVSAKVLRESESKVKSRWQVSAKGGGTLSCHSNCIAMKVKRS